jgi:hypothetical protein
MAYRDDLDALNAQVRTLKAELEASHQARTAAQAATQAAQAAADEAALAARRSEALPAPRRDGGRRWVVIAGTVGALLAAVAGYLSFRLMSAGAETQRMHASVVKLEGQARRLQLRVRQGENEKTKLNHKINMLLNRLVARTRRPPDAQEMPPPRPPETPPRPPETLGRGQIQAGMRSIKQTVQACYDRYKVPGLANVQVRIARAGVVSSAKVKGMLKGTPTGRCVARAARRARFARFAGNPITITYPFILR